MIRLNLGCGTNFLPMAEGWINIDCERSFQPDDLCRLDVDPWAYVDDSVDEVLFNHSLEHMGATVEGFRHVIQELYRVCKTDAVVQINVPHPRHDDFLNDPTHVRPITPTMLGLLSREQCAFFKEQKAANTPLADMWGVDFKVEKVEQALDPAYEHWRGDQGIAKMISQYANVIKEVRIALRVVKPR